MLGALQGRPLEPWPNSYGHNPASWLDESLGDAAVIHAIQSHCLQVSPCPLLVLGPGHPQTPEQPCLLVSLVLTVLPAYLTVLNSQYVYKFLTS